MLFFALFSSCTPTIAERVGDHRFATPIDAPSTVALLDGGEIDTRAATCGTCHVDHHAEWSQSTHAYAVRDVQYLAELGKPGQPRWLCLNCHAPTAPQRAERITPDTRLGAADSIEAVRAEPNPDYDARRTPEGVTCASCHVRRDADGKGTIVGPRGSGRAPHRVRHDQAALRGVCEGCHSPGEQIVLTPTFPCWFTTAEEIAAGPRAGEECVSCHMPSTARPAAEGAPAVPLQRHTWTGGGIPKTEAGFATLAERGWESGVDVTLAIDPPRVTLTNARAAHAIPTGDPERHLVVRASVLDAAGVELAADTLRIGQRWDWGDAATGRAARKLDDNRLGPGEVREWRPTLPPAPAGASLQVVVTHVRLTPENAAHMGTATIDAELRTLWPEAPNDLDVAISAYPKSREVYRGSVAFQE